MDKIKERCRDCCYLVEDESGCWVCDVNEEEIHNVSNEDCELIREMKHKTCEDCEFYQVRYGSHRGVMDCDPDEYVCTSIHNLDPYWWENSEEGYGCPYHCWG